MITGRRHETLTLHTIMQGMSTSECEWLLPPNNPKRTHDHQSEAEMKKRRELLQEFLFWYFDGFLVPLLKVRVRVAALNDVFGEGGGRVVKGKEGKSVHALTDDLLHHRILRLPEPRALLSAGRLADFVCAPGRPAHGEYIPKVE